MIKKILSIFLVLVLSLSGLVFNAKDVNAEPLFRVMDIDVDNTDMSDVNVLYVERGDTLNIRVETETVEPLPIGFISIKDVRIKAEIDGYEYDDIEDSSEMFDMEAGVRYVKHLTLSIPEDIDASQNYDLRIRVYNREENIETPYTLRIKSQRHLLDIKDVLFTPGLNLNADQPLFTTVRIENMGDKKEEDIKVEVSVPQLGRSGATYIDELVSFEELDHFEEGETSESSDSIYMDLRGAQPGTYDLIVKVEYNRGHDELTQSYKLTIAGASKVTVQESLIVDATEKSKSTAAGQGVVYKVDIANMGSTVRTFTGEVSGLDWGSYRVDPALTIVQPGSTGELFVYVSPNQDVNGQKTFTMNVKEGNNVVKQISFQTNVIETEGKWDNVSTGLEIGFIVLLIILVILGIILAVTKMGKKENNEPLGESYY